METKIKSRIESATPIVKEPKMTPKGDVKHSSSPGEKGFDLKAALAIFQRETVNQEATLPASESVISAARLPAVIYL